jgi:DNA-binding NtrC family response regulator
MGRIESFIFVRSPRRIAIVDDEPPLCSLFSQILGENGFEVVYIGNSGEEILEAIAQGALDKVDMVLLDYNLGNGIDGLKTAARIKRHLPKVTIILVTAEVSIRKEVLASGLSFLEKPFSIEEFLKVVGHEDDAERAWQRRKKGISTRA